MDPQIVAFDPSSFDFGKVFQAEHIKHEFKLVNRSTNEIRVLALRSSCQCTLIEKELAGKIIAPKGFLRVPVDFQTSSQRGPGGANVEALLESQGQRYYAKAFINAYVDADFEFEPRSLNFGAIKVGEKATQAIKLVPRALQDLTVKQPESNGALKVSLSTNIAGSSSKVFELNVTIHAPSVRFSQVFSTVLSVETSSKRVPVLIIPVSAVISPELEIAPDIIVLSGKATSGETRLTIRTFQASRVLHTVVTKSKISKEVPVTADPSGSEETWDLTHVRRIGNSFLAGAERIDFDLEVRNGTAPTEARSVSVQVKSL